MLPRFDKLDVLFAKAMKRAIYQMARQDGLLQQISTHAIHEGRNSAIVRPDQSVDKTELQSSEASVTLSFDDIENIDLQKILDYLQTMAKQLACTRFG